MMDNKNKMIVMALTVAFVICLGAGGIGFMNRSSVKKTEEKMNYKITKLYFVDGEQVETMPVNSEEEILYVHDDDNSSCTNNVVAIWNNDDWDINIPNPNTNTTCKIYFKSTKAVVAFNTTNGSLEGENIEENSVKITKGEDLVQKIQPTNGYKFSSVTCANNEETSWNENEKELTIKNVQEDTECEVIFDLSNFELKLAVSNGNGAVTKTYAYDSSVVLNVTPNNGYDNPEISCTNDQVASWNNNEFKIEKIVNDTSCTVQFRKLEYVVSILVAGGTTTETTKKVDYGSNASFTITPESGFSTNIKSNNCSNVNSIAQNGKVIVTLSNITSDIACDIILTPAQTIQTSE